VTGRWTQIVLDGVGVGELPDADRYDDVGSNTLGNISSARPLHIPNLMALGIGNILPLYGIPPAEHPSASFGKMAEGSPAKDSTIGHWELAGLISTKPLPTYHNGFPPDIIDAFKKATGRSILGNIVASGTEIIQELGDKHCQTGFPIVYTSADSVFQIAAHEEVIPPDELYTMCRAARQILQGEHAVGRVIARPFVGENGHYTRTRHRRDFSLPPPGTIIMDLLMKRGIPTVGIGKIDDLFAGRGLSVIQHTESNDHGITTTIKAMKETGSNFIFTNLIDFDMLWGHRNDIQGFAQGLEAFDARLPELLEALDDQDVLVITADHGNDPTTPSTDHSREYVPLLITGSNLRIGINLGIRSTFADLAATAADYFGIAGTGAGTSFWKELILE
jgi:phosphopentomutase